MRTKLFLWAIGIGLFVGGYAVAVDRIRAELEGVLANTFGREALFQGSSVTFPPGVRLSGVTIPPGDRESSVSIELVNAHLNLISVLRARPRVDLELKGLKFLIERDTLKRFYLPLRSGHASVGRGFPLSQFRVKKGEIILLDRAVSPLVFCVLRDLNVSAKAGPKPGQWSYAATGGIHDGSQESIGQFQIKGQLYRLASSEAKVSVNYQRMAQLTPYLRGVLGTAPSRGAFELDSTLRLMQGTLLADNQVEITGAAFPTDEPTVLGPSGNRLVELLKDRKGMVHLSFMVKGKIGGPLDWSNLVQATLREALQQALARDIQKTLTEAESPRSVEEGIRRGMESIGH